MENSNIGKAEFLIQQSGCGPFQVLIVLLVNVLNKIVTAITMMLMAFGNFNPGWRCGDTPNINTISNNTLENRNYSIFGTSRTVTETSNNSSTWNFTLDANSGTMYNDVDTASEVFVDIYNETLSVVSGGYPYQADACPIYDACQTIEFNPQASTIVTEWGLLCDGGWVPSLIISIQMAGVLVGSFVSGQLGDMFGRKMTLYCALALNGVFNIASIFVPNWQLFAAFKLVIGVCLGCMFNLYFILPSEYLNGHWRSRMIVLPAWHIGGILFAVAAMLCEDWKTMHAIAGGSSLVSCLVALWAPESLRWLEVQKKHDQFQRVARHMLAINKVQLDIKPYDDSLLQPDKAVSSPKNKKIYTILDIFRKGFRMYSVIIGFLWLVPSMIYYAIGFGVKAMYGDFYINLIIVFAIDIPFCVFPFLALHYLGRKTACILFFSIATLCLLAATGIELWASVEVKQTGSFVLALLGKLTTNGGLAAVIAITGEIYPTVVRSNGVGYANLVCRFGGIAAPFLIPQDGSSIFICYGIMGFLCLMCCVVVTKLPETKGKELQEYFVDSDEDQN